jgi:hypothetical protein
MADRNFTLMRLLKIPFSGSSAQDQIDMLQAGIPIDTGTGDILDDLSFGYVNTTGYDVFLKGFPKGSEFKPVTPQNADWIIQARSEKGLFLSKKPLLVSVAAFSTNGNPIAAGADFTGCFLAMPYGRGR